jgi:hypothetical protein
MRMTGLRGSRARKFVIHCTANDGGVITYVIDRLTGEIFSSYAGN